MARLSPPRSALVILGSYALTALVVGVMVMEALQGRWSTLFFGAGCIFGFLAGLRVGLSTEEATAAETLPIRDSQHLPTLEPEPGFQVESEDRAPAPDWAPWTPLTGPERARPQ